MNNADMAGSPLWEGQDIFDLRMPVQCKALVSAARHVAYDHEVAVSEFPNGGLKLLAVHLKAHGLTIDPAQVRNLLPFDVTGGVHRLAEAGGDIASLADFTSSGFVLANPTTEELLEAVGKMMEGMVDPVEGKPISPRSRG